MQNHWIALTRDKFFGRKLTLLAERSGVTLTVAQGDPLPTDAEGYFVDRDTYDGKMPEGARVYVFSRTREDCLPIPTPIETVETLLSGEGNALSLDADGRRAAVGTRSVTLTEVEGALLRVLLDAEGASVSAKTLIDEVWKGNATHSCVNVYIHYLRQKLESRGERIIRSRRGEGYYIDEKYRKEGKPC